MSRNERLAIRSSANRLSRRRAIGILAVAAGLPLLGGSKLAPSGHDRATVAELSRGILQRSGLLTRWQGPVMGADAEIRLYHPDSGTARAIIAACLNEVERLERIFSLYREESELCLLNRDSRLDSPSGDMRRLLSFGRAVAARSDGAFDPTVQPLWNLYANHFTKFPADETGPDRDAVVKARALVDYRRIHVGPAAIVLDPRTEITLNGIAQGYITDRVADVLHGMGVENVLLDLGETRALGPRPDGGPWRIGLVDPAAPNRVARRLDLVNRAIATSGGYGTPFDRAGRFHHLFEPERGRCAQYYAAVSVIAGRAVLADALSTALYVMPFDAAKQLLSRFRGVGAYLTFHDGRMTAV